LPCIILHSTKFDTNNIVCLQFFLLIGLNRSIPEKQAPPKSSAPTSSTNVHAPHRPTNDDAANTDVEEISIVFEESSSALQHEDTIMGDETAHKKRKAYEKKKSGKKSSLLTAVQQANAQNPVAAAGAGDSILMQGRPEVWDESMCGASANQQNAAADASLDPDL
jgi:hypothetical protein